jgi:dipeptidase D
MKTILDLEPKNVWQFFYELTQIPRPSGKEEKVREYLVKVAKENNLEVMVDETGNVIIRRPASPGFENRKVVTLQAHMDMVPQKNMDKNFDFEKDPIQTVIDGEWLRADGTTLGADNGIGLAAALAVLTDKNLKTGMIEALVTVDEERGMTGVFGLKPNVLKGDILLNLDSEDEGEIFIGCAGGMDGSITFNISREPVPAGYKAFEVELKGLKGGHSGLDINLGRLNANKGINRFLKHVMDHLDALLVSFNGGSLRNAIPREASAIILVPENKVNELMEAKNTYEKNLLNEFGDVEPTLQFNIKETQLPSSYIKKDIADKIVKAIYGCPNGVLRMSTEVEGLVETSNNLASVKTYENKVEIQCLMRSSIDSAKEAVGEKIKSVFELAGAEVVLSGAYPGWKPNPNSEILSLAKKLYQDKYGKIPEIKAVHAGLECGLIGSKYPNLDMISFGPTIVAPHSPDERVHIESVKKFYDFLVEIIKNIPNKN